MKKKFISLMSLVMLVLITTITVNAQDSEETFYIRGGFSDVTGFIATEYVVDNVGFSVGWHKYTPDIIDRSASSVDFALTFYGAPYYENSYYLSVGYATTNSVQTINGQLDKWAGTWGFIGGYKFGGDFMDVKIGAGYLTSEIVNGAAIDVSVGLVL